jgi:hypothetical protein
MPTKIYITHCSASKDPSFRESGLPTTPDRLYTSSHLQAFVHRCQTQNVPWAIHSDLYGVWFPTEEHVWYEKNPSKVTPDEFKALLARFDDKLKPFQEIFFYYPNPTRVHPLYRNLFQTTQLKARIRLFSHIREICP